MVPAPAGARVAHRGQWTPQLSSAKCLAACGLLHRRSCPSLRSWCHLWDSGWLCQKSAVTAAAASTVASVLPGMPSLPNSGP
eukprot:3217156-Lingulodinium_polyedra.AAC.1